MVEHVNGFKTSDGRMFESEKYALEHELWLGVSKIFPRNVDWRFSPESIILRHRKQLLDVLQSEASVALYKFES
jgi:hypothetical protein